MQEMSFNNNSIDFREQFIINVFVGMIICPLSVDPDSSERFHSKFKHQQKLYKTVLK